MKLKRDFILYSNINKPPPKTKIINKESNNIIKKIPREDLEEMPQIRKAFQYQKKPYLRGIKSDGKPEYIRLDKQMSESDIKIYTKINDMKEKVFEVDQGDEDDDNGNIAEENELFQKNYQKIKKEKNKFNRGTYLDYEPFLNISCQYIAKNMKVPHLSEDHNLFSANPLILQGSELENYILYNLGDRTKGVKFLTRLDDYLEKKISGNSQVSVKEMERLEKLKNEEKPKGYIPPEVEIPMLKNDINNCENSLNNIVELEEFFKTKKRVFSLKKNNSYMNIFKKSFEISPRNKFTRKLSSNYNLENIYQNNSLVTATTSIGITRKSSPKVGHNKYNGFNFNNIGLNIPKDHQFKLPKLETPLRSPSNIFNSNSHYKSHNPKIKIKKISFNNNLKVEFNSVSRNNDFSPSVFNSMQNNEKELNNRLHKLGNQNKMYKLLKISSKSSNNDNNNKKENGFMTTESEIDEIMELNKEIENKTQEKNEEDENEKEEIKTLDINLNKDKNYEKIRINLCPKIKERKSKIEKLKIIKKENNKNNLGIKDKSIISLMKPKIDLNEDKNNKEKESKSFDKIKNDPNEKRYNQIENLFNLAKEKQYNNLQNDNKKDIESYFGSRGKNLKNLLTTKSTYYALHNLMKNSLDRDIISEEYILRNRFKVKKLDTSKQKIILDKNKGFVREIVKQESKFNDILYKYQKQSE